MLVIFVVCFIVALITPFVDRVLKKNITSKWLLLVVQLVVYFIIFAALYSIAALLGFSI